MSEDESQLQGRRSEAGTEGGSSPGAPVSDELMIVPVRGMVLFPGVVLPITVARPRSVAAAQEAVRQSRQVGFLMQRDTQAEEIPSGTRPPPHRHHRQAARN